MLMNNNKKEKLKKNLKGLWEFVKFIALVAVIVLPIRIFIAQPFVVSGESMFPTFTDGDYLIVDEISYTLKGAHRGDVVIFRYPNDPKRFFIKRIIGMPNEKIEITNGAVKIYNSENTEGFILNEPYINESFDTTETYITKSDEYFVMGDNRNRSSDSRMWGVLPKKLIMGRAYLRLLPVKELDYLPGHINNYK